MIALLRGAAFAGLGLTLGLCASVAHAADPPPLDSPTAPVPSATAPASASAPLPLDPETAKASPANSAPSSPALAPQPDARPPLAPRLAPLPPMPPQPPAARERTDPMFTMGLALTAAGGAGLAIATALIATAPTPKIPTCDPCSKFGCSGEVGDFGSFCGREEKNSSQKIIGSGLLGASLVTVLVGAPVLALGAGPEPSEVGPRQSDSWFLAGIGLSAFGAAALAGSALSGISDTRGDHAIAAIPFALLGTTSLLVGIPVWASNARRMEVPNDSGVRWVRRSRGMAVAGATLTILGASLMGGGSMFASFGQDQPEIHGLSAALAFSGVGLLMTGVPVWYLGQERVPIDAARMVGTRSGGALGSASLDATEGPRAERASAPAYVPPARTARPEIQVGPTSIGMRMVF